MAHSRRAAPALARLPEIDPAIAALSLWCAYRDASGATVTRGETILIGPDLPRLPISEQTGVIAHHVLHVALRHSARRALAQERHGPDFRSDLYDLACDALVNEALLQGGHALPRPAVRAAEIAALLPKDQRPDHLLADWDSDRLYAVLADLQGRSGDGSGGGEGEIAEYMTAQGFGSDLIDSPGETTEAEIWAGRMEQALSAGSRAGGGIGAVLARFGDLPRATIPWEIRLRRLLMKVLLQQPRQHPLTPSRAWLARDALARETRGPEPAFTPGLARQSPSPRLLIAVDTSSSIRDATLDLFMAEALSATRRSGAKAHLLAFDTEVHARTRLTSAASLAGLELRRGGGTDFTDVLREAEALRPSLAILLTDLDAPVPLGCRCPVLWAAPAPPTISPPFGEVLVMDDQG